MKTLHALAQAWRTFKHAMHAQTNLIDDETVAANVYTAHCPLCEHASVSCRKK